MIHGITKAEMDKSYAKFVKKMDQIGKDIFGVREWNKMQKKEKEFDGICLYPKGCGKRKGTCQLTEPCEKYVPAARKGE